MNKLQAVICTCKLYEDAAELFKMAVESKICSDINVTYFTDSPLNFNSAQICIPDQMSWSRRIGESLNRIEGDYVLFFMEDYYLLNMIDFGELEYLARELDALYIRLANIPRVGTRERSISKINSKLHYGINLQLSYWKREFLSSILIKIDGNPWQTEIALKSHFLISGINFSRAYYFSSGIRVLNGVIKGKWDRKIHHCKLFSNVNIPQVNIRTMNRREQFYYDSKVFLGNLLDRINSRKIIKAIAIQFGFKFISKE